MLARLNRELIRGYSRARSLHPSSNTPSKHISTCSTTNSKLTNHKSQVVISTWTFRPDPTKQALPWYRDTRGSIYGTRRGSLHSGATGTSATLTMKDIPEAKPYGYGSYEPRGVTIIGRPEEAFARSPNKQRTTISTWGF